MKNRLFVLLLALLPASLLAQAAFTAVFKKGEGPIELVLGSSWEEFQDTHASLQAKGFRLIDVETGTEEGRRLYYGIWKEDQETHSIVLRKVPGWDSLVTLKRQMAKDTFVMQDIEAYTADSQSFYLATWAAGSTKHKVRKLSSWQGLMNDHKEMGRRELQMVDLEGFEGLDGRTKYLALYQRRSPEGRTYPFRAPNPESFSTDKVYRNKSRYYLFDFEQFEKRDIRFLFGLYDAQRPGDTLVEAWGAEALLEKARQFKEDGMVLYDLDVRSLE